MKNVESIYYNNVCYVSEVLVSYISQRSLTFLVITPDTGDSSTVIE